MTVELYDLSEDVIASMNLSDYDWHWITCKKKLSEDFLRRFSDKIDMKWVVASQDVSEDFIREFQDQVSWYQISRKYFSEKFIKEFANKIDWYCLAFFQSRNLSEDFIREIQNFIPDYVWGYLFTNVERSKSFIKEFWDKITLFGVEMSWYSKSKKNIEELWHEMNLDIA